MYGTHKIVGFVDPMRAKKWEFMTKKRDGTYREDCSTAYDRYALETMLDNVEKTSYTTAVSQGMPANMGESTLTTNLAAFNKFAFPLVRQIFSNVVGKELVSIQPMKGPTSLIFYLKFLRNTGGTGLNDRDPAGSWPTAGESREYGHDPGELQTGIRQINMEITSETVTATTKKLLTNYSVELTQDLLNVHNMDANAVLSPVMATEMAREIDEHILNLLVGQAGAGNVLFNTQGYTGGLPTEIAAYEKRILNAFISCNNLIFSNIYKDATFIVGSIAAVERLEQLETFEYTKGVDQATSLTGVRRIGTLSSRWKVYKDPFFPTANKFLMGFKGASWLEVGMVYAPYVPYLTTEPFTNPNSFSVTKAAMSRQAFKMINANAYATLELVSS